MADYAEKVTSEPPPTLSLFWACRKWGTLPEAGGILDQPLWLDWLESAGYVYECYKLKAKLTPVELIEKHPDVAGLVISIDRARGLI